MASVIDSFLDRYKGGTPADVFGPQKQYYFDRWTFHPGKKLYILDVPILGIYRPRGFTIAQYLAVNRALVVKLQAQEKPFRGTRRGSLPDPSTMGESLSGKAGVLEFFQHKEIGSSTEAQKVMRDQLGESNFARQSQSALKDFLAKEQVKYDQMRRDHPEDE